MSGTDAVKAEDARELVGKHEVLVIDIRPEDEFAEVRINGSKRADPDDVESVLEDAGEGSPERVMLVCADGSESAELAGKLNVDGREFTSLDGGIAAWESKGNPVAPRPDEEYEGPPVKTPGAVASESGPEEDDEGEDAEDENSEEPRAEGTAQEERAEPGRDDEDEQAEAAADAEATRGE